MDAVNAGQILRQVGGPQARVCAACAIERIVRQAAFIGLGERDRGRLGASHDEAGVDSFALQKGQQA